MTDFDHAVVNVLGKMDEAVTRYEQLGFTLTPRGYHTLGSINHLAIFADCYLELLGYAPGEREKRAEMWEHPEGLTGLAVRAENAAAIYDALRSKGAPVEPYKDFSRPVSINGEEKTASFRTFQFNRDEISNGRIFFCQHNTPELIWRSQWQSHPNGATGIAAATIIASDPSRLSTLLAKVPGIADGESLQAGRTSLRVVRAGDLSQLFPGVPEFPGLEGGEMRMVALDLFTASLDGTAAFLQKSGVPFKSDESAITILPDIALGLVVRFVQQS